MTKKLEGKTAVITGGTEGIGFATAKLFVKEGAYVFITGRRQKELEEAVKAIGRAHQSESYDIRSGIPWSVPFLGPGPAPEMIRALQKPQAP
jgi:NAD(P)-dependent dehydrogenase (short-subunit alcohol dehydrogenase family)